MPNITQIQPEIPNAPEAPQRVTDTPIQQTPYNSPAIITSRPAREQTKENLKELSRLTGRNYTL